ncbi:lysophospholipid acyltransferase family protein [Marinobacteraceae bacterium S3BR75-40.1]
MSVKLQRALRLVLRLALFVGVLVMLVATALLLRLRDLFSRQPADRVPIANGFLHALCAGLGYRVRVEGQPVIDAPVLYVSNHISWTDIPVLLAQTPLRFLAKKEVGKWPVIGWLAREGGTLFIDRGKGQSGQVRQQIAQALGDGDSVLVFPEGTTSDGTGVLPFHGRLLAAAADADVPVQPITLGYRRRGQPDTIVPFIGNDDFHRHLWRLLRYPGLEVTVIYHRPRWLQGGAELGACIETLQQDVASGLARIHQPSALPGSYASARP